MSNENKENSDSSEETRAKPTITIAERNAGESEAKPTITIAEKQKSERSDD